VLLVWVFLVVVVVVSSDPCRRIDRSRNNFGMNKARKKPTARRQRRKIQSMGRSSRQSRDFG